MDHRAIGRLRGRAEPRQDILDRLLTINPRFRVYWAPPSQDFPGAWEIYEFRDNPVRKMAGHHMLARLDRMKLERRSASAQQGLNLGMWRKAEELIDQVHLVMGFLTDEQFGGDWMFRELGESEATLRAREQELKLELDRIERQEIDGEADDNPVFDAYLRDLCSDEYTRVCLGAVSKGWTPRSEAAPTTAPRAPTTEQVS